MRTIGLLLLLASLAPSQTGDRFEVAAIHPNLSGQSGTRIDMPEGGRLKITNYSLKTLIRRAWNMQNDQIIGGPGWLDTERFDIEASTGRPEKIDFPQLKTLLQALLADRFHLKTHTETRDLTCYSLLVESGGPKLREHTGNPGTSVNDNLGSERSQMTADNVSMLLFADYLGDRLDRVVVDKTGLQGGFNFKLEWAPQEAVNPTGASIFGALREQLGLRLESQKNPVQVLVVDSAERPSGN